MIFFKILFLLLFVKPDLPISIKEATTISQGQKFFDFKKEIKHLKTIFQVLPVSKLETTTDPTSSKHANSHNSASEKIKNQQPESRAITLYNLAVSELSLDKKDMALLFFERAFYNYLFFPALEALNFLESPVSFIPLIWHSIMGIYAITSLFLIWFLIVRKTSLKTRIKAFVFWSLILTALGAFNTFGLKPKGRSIKSFELKNAPLKGAFLLATYKKGEPFIALKTKGIWVKIKTSQNQRGWTLRKNLYFTQD